GEVAGAGVGHHGAAVREGDDVWFYYFRHPAQSGGPASDQGPESTRRSAVHRARVTVVDGELRVTP
ncbi:MAG TPA: hypothetical protein VL853_05005, partial [Gemmatimonadales bacterium]|nr:hypothetical protein [Gemmatimonadales bacterium]